MYNFKYDFLRRSCFRREEKTSVITSERVDSYRELPPPPYMEVPAKKVERREYIGTLRF